MFWLLVLGAYCLPFEAARRASIICPLNSGQFTDIIRKSRSSQTQKKLYMHIFSKRYFVSKGRYIAQNKISGQLFQAHKIIEKSCVKNKPSKKPTCVKNHRDSDPLYLTFSAGYQRTVTRHHLVTARNRRRPLVRIQLRLSQLRRRGRNFISFPSCCRTRLFGSNWRLHSLLPCRIISCLKWLCVF